MSEHSLNEHSPPLPTVIYDALVRDTLREDLGRAGDLTTDATVPAGVRAVARLRARKAGRVAGLAPALHAFRLLDPGAEVEVVTPDGADVAAGQDIARVRGEARALLTAERTALNLLGHLCGIATTTRTLVEAVAGTKARIACTRKTTPLLRALEKHAVRCGGGSNHRYGLDDAILIKDNHRVIAGGAAAAVRRAKQHAGHLVKIEVEVDELDELEALMALGVDVVLLDNMGPEMLRRAVEIVAGRAVTEASGGITPETAGSIAASGVDLLSVGWITHSAPSLDVGLDLELEA